MFLPNFLSSARAVGFRMRWLAAMVAIQIGATVFEALSVASIVPALEYMQATKSIEDLAATSQGWRILAGISRSTGLPLGFGMVIGIAYGSILIRQAFTYTRIVFVARLQNRLLKNIRQRGLRSFLEARLDAQEAHGEGDIVNDLTIEAQRALACVSSAASVISYMLVLLAYILIILSLSVSLSLVALAVMFVVGLGLQLITRQVRRHGADQTRTNQIVTSFLMQRLSSARLVRLSGMEDVEISVFTKFLENQRRVLDKLQKSLALLGVLVEPLALLFGFVLLYFAAERKMVRFESLILFFFILLRIVPIAKELLLSRQSYVSLLGSVETLGRRFSTLHAAREIDHGKLELVRLRSGIILDGVTFTYQSNGASQNANRAALSGISLTIVAGQTVALVGPSGSGKSTLIDLLPLLKVPQAGRILFDRVPQEDISLASLRRAIAYAPQTPQLFDVSVEEHIRYGKPNATTEELRTAARLSQALPFIEALPEGFKTKVGNNGDRLSGGQRQRLDLARALVRNAPILILDEPTANLDAESAHYFGQALQQIRAERKTTIIIIGHNLNSVRHADQIVVLNGGRIEAVGTHDELVGQSGWYARSYALQREAPQHVMTTALKATANCNQT